jgi:hypothetical protein
LLCGCGLQVSSPDLFQLTRTGQGAKLTLLVNDGGTIRCNGQSAKPLPNSMLLDARHLVTALDKDAKAKLRLPGSAQSVFTFELRMSSGTVTFADTAAAAHPELAQTELFALSAARGPCGLGAT